MWEDNKHKKKNVAEIDVRMLSDLICLMIGSMTMNHGLIDVRILSDLICLHDRIRGNEPWTYRCKNVVRFHVLHDRIHGNEPWTCVNERKFTSYLRDR
jgi:hypothetical protein